MGAQAKLAEANARIAALQPAARDGSAARGRPRHVASARPPRPARKPRAQVELERRATWASGRFGLVTRNRGLLDLLDDVAKLATSDTPILVLGESGTGKELVAEGVHRLSGRAGQFMAINCGAIPRDMIESELFGHVAGAFTGATRDKPGMFEACDNGTVFLDEIGEMSVDLQSRLLRFLERSEARRVGSNKNYSVDTRMVAATNRDRVALERGEGFRPDLYYRLAHAVIVLPPLRRRGDDVQVLVDHFLAEFARLQNRQYSIGDSARDRLGKHSWPGNVRQLRAVLRRAVLLSTPGRPIEAGRAPARRGLGARRLCSRSWSGREDAHQRGAGSGPRLAHRGRQGARHAPHDADQQDAASRADVGPSPARSASGVSYLGGGPKPATRIRSSVHRQPDSPPRRSSVGLECARDSPRLPLTPRRERAYLPFALLRPSALLA